MTNIWYSEREMKLVNKAVDYVELNKCKAAPVIKVLIKEFENLSTIPGNPRRNSSSVMAKYYYESKKRSNKAVKTVVSQPVVEELSIVKSQSKVQTIDSLLVDLKKAVGLLKEENATLKEDKKELITRLRALKDIRQAVESYQKKV